MNEFNAVKFITASITKVLSTYNVVVGAIIAVLTAIFGTYWYVFVAYLVANILDWLTGWHKARKLKQESSAVGLRGIVKKTGYWVIIAVSFLIPSVLIPLGKDMLGLDLGFLFMLGWFTLCTLEINEFRSIVENLAQAGYDVPYFLIKGLEITAETVNGAIRLPGADKAAEEDKTEDDEE